MAWLRVVGALLIMGAVGLGANALEVKEEATIVEAPIEEFAIPVTEITLLGVAEANPDFVVIDFGTTGHRRRAHQVTRGVAVIACPPASATSVPVVQAVQRRAQHRTRDSPYTYTSLADMERKDNHDKDKSHATRRRGVIRWRLQ